MDAIGTSRTDALTVTLRRISALRANVQYTFGKTTDERERIDYLELNVSVFNVFNRVNAATYVGVITSPLFGRANAAGIARTAQLSLRYRF